MMFFAVEKENKNTIQRKVACFREKKMKTSVKKANSSVNSVSLFFVACASLVLFGACYLYQVNCIATKGIEMKKLENEISSLEEERKKMRIKEMELKSMYNIEKEVKDFDLVGVSEISYVEIDGPVAMK